MTLNFFFYSIDKNSILVSLRLINNYTYYTSTTQNIDQPCDDTEVDEFDNEL